MLTWHGVTTEAREWIGRARALVRPRHVVRALLVFLLVSGAGIVLEAALRARLGPLEGRMPSGLYTRATGWAGGTRGPELLAVVDGAPSEWREVRGLADFPEHLVDAVLAVEDQRFATHHGLDLRRIAGAMVANVRAGGLEQGGSTITQQLAKNLYLDARRTPLRKMREAAMAMALELRYDKDAILAAYLNEIYLGQDGGRAIHGMGAAARYYFDTDVARLGLAESALLAGMIRSPNRLMPLRHPRDATARRDLVLDLMADQDRIPRDAARRATRVRVPTRVHAAGTMDGRYFRDAAAATLGRRLPARGVRVATTLDPVLQHAAERAVRGGLAVAGLGDAEAALVALDPRTGEVLALVGGRDYGASQFNRATDARRQPGSAFKPFVAVAALSPHGEDAPALTLASTLRDEPFRVEAAGGDWQPVNYDGTYHGEVTFRDAMERSLNVPFARVGMLVGPPEVVATARRLGITSELRPVPSLALGSSEVTLLELVRGYGVLAAGGWLAPTRMITARRMANGDETLLPPATATQVIAPAVAFLVTSMLQGVVASGTGRALANGRSGAGLAGKTGTSNDWRDAWFVAYSPSLVVGVWVGHDDGRPLHRTGATAALPIVARFLAAGAPRAARERFPVPDGVVQAVTTSDRGWFAVCGDPEWFLAGTEPAREACHEPGLPNWIADMDLGDLGDLEALLDRGGARGSRTMRRLEREVRDRATAWLRRLAEREGVRIDLP